jgi:hypothetical protein
MAKELILMQEKITSDIRFSADKYSLEQGVFSIIRAANYYAYGKCT